MADEKVLAEQLSALRKLLHDEARLSVTVALEHDELNYTEDPASWNEKAVAYAEDLRTLNGSIFERKTLSLIKENENDKVSENISEIADAWNKVALSLSSTGKLLKIQALPS